MNGSRVGLAVILCTCVLAPASVRAAEDEPAPAGKPRIVIRTEAARPAILPPLYVSLAALQVYDGYTTLNGVNRGARETNALVGGLAGKPAALWAVKVGSTAFSILLAERLWREHHRGEAILTMVVSNAVMTAVAARNASILRSQR